MRGLRPTFLLLVLTATALAGCIADEGAPVQAPAEVQEDLAAPPGVVVTDIGPGVNPYHAVFRRPEWTHAPWDAVPGMDNVTVLNLTLGDDYAASRAADEAIWAAYEPGVLYWVNGTSLLLYTHRAFDWLPDGNERTFHGTGSAGAVALACPECFVLALQDSRSIDGQALDVVREEMPWVDLAVSTNIPGPAYDPVFGHYQQATRDFWDAGRLYVSFAGNTPVVGLINIAGPFPIHYIDFPPWVVTVGGAHSECHATELSAGKPPEFVGNFTQPLARQESVHDYSINHGTSFSTPQVAGAFGRALWTVRQAHGYGDDPTVLWKGAVVAESGYLGDGVLTQEELRAAMAGAAHYFATADYTPSCSAFAPVPASPAPWLDMGWGYLGADEGLLAGAILLGEAQPDAKPTGAAEWMALYMDARALLYPW